jgi:formylmethanofuran dehydrogenase subunit E
MAMTKDIIDDAELAKSRIANSNMSDEYKRMCFKLIHLSTTATNGISTEEKIQKMTEAIQLLATTQSLFVTEVDTKINVSVQKANRSQCLSCKAMKYVEDK